jgi:hypothetical protein
LIAAFDRATVSASKYVAVQRRDYTVSVTGDGMVIDVPPIVTAEQWCEYHGVAVEHGIATLYKAVRGNFASGHDPTFFWTPGTSPSVSMMDANECGVGLHAVPHPCLGLRFYAASDVKFVGFPVQITEMQVTATPVYPEKVKFRCVAGPVFEVDRYGKPLAVVAEATA